MKGAIKPVLLLWLSSVPGMYQLDPQAVTKKTDAIAAHLYKRSFARGTLHILVFGTVMSELWQWYGLLTKEEAEPFASSLSSDAKQWSFMERLYSRPVWEKIGSYAVKICSLFLVQSLLQRIERSVMVVETVDWCIQNYAPYVATLQQLKSYCQAEIPTDYQKKMILKNLQLLCDQLEYLVAYILVQAKYSKMHRNKYEQIAHFLLKNCNQLLYNIPCDSCKAFVDRLEQLDRLIGREINQLRIMQGPKKEYTVLTRL